MSQSRAAAFLTVLRESQLLEPTQVDELAESAEAKANDLNGLAKVILQKGWLTRFQLTLVGQGKTKDLMLGAYRLLDRLGEGGMGQVFKAYHQPMGRTVALKVIRKEKLGSSQAVQRFFREVQAAAKLVHPNIVVAFDANQVSGTHYFAMEYVEGIDLAKLVKQNGPLPVPVACDYIRQAAMGLQHAHEQGMVHRDIKPHNLLVGQASDYSASRSGSSSQVGQKAVVKILDMGLARLSTTSADQGLTQDGAVIGTPEYIPPEQALDARGADIRSDLYSLGGVFFYLLTGRPPFQGGTLTEMLLRHQMEAAPDVRTLRAEVPADVAAIVARLLAKKPEDRFQTPIDLAQALEPICQGGSNPYVLPKKASNDSSVFGDLGGSVDSPSGATVAQPSLAGKTSFRKKQPEPAGMNKGLVAALAGAAVVAIALVVYLVIPKGEPQTQAQAPVAPPVPEKTTPGPVVPLPPPTPVAAVAEFTLKPLAPVTVKAGDSAMLPVQVERKGPADKPIQVRLEGVPETAGQVFTIEPGKNDVQIKIAAPAGARAAQRTLTVVASLGSVERSTQVQLTVEARTEPPVVVTKPPMVEPPPPVAKKAEPPDAAKQAEILKLIKDLYKQDYAKTRSADKRAFSDKLLGIAEESKNDATARFVLLREAADLAASAGHAEGAIKAIDQLDEEFAIEETELKAQALTLAAKAALTTTEQKAIAAAAMTAADEASETEKYDTVLQLVTLAETAARKGQAADLLPLIVERAKELREIPREIEAGKAAAAVLKDKPEDPEANLVLGKFLCFRKSDWDAGLSHLAKGSDAALQAAAKNDLKKPNLAPALAEAGDAWWDLAAAATGSTKTKSLQRASFWYQQASPGLTGLALDRVEGRIKQIGADAKPRSSTIPMLPLTGHTDKVICVAISPDSKKAITGSADKTLKVWDLETGKEAATLTAHSQGVLTVTWSEDAQFGASGDSYGTFFYWDLVRYQSLRRTDFSRTRPPDSMAITRTNPVMVFTNSLGRVQRWTLQGDVTSETVQLGPAHALAIIPDSRLALAGRDDGSLVLWEIDTFKEQRRWPGHAGPILTVAVSPDGKQGATGGADKWVRIWNLSTGRVTQVLKGHQGKVTAVAMTSDGRQVLTGSEDRTLRLWDSITGREVRRFPVHPDGVTGAAVSADGRYIVSICGDKVARLWDLKSFVVKPIK